ncbi:hypothetical protein ABIE28_002481 [Devosia sp. 2618]
MLDAQPLHEVETEAYAHGAPDVLFHFGMLGRQGQAGLVGSLHHVFEVAQVDIHRPDVDTVVHGVTDDLAGRIKAHGLAVQQRGGENVRVTAFDPAADIDQQRERSGMGFRKTIRPKTLDLPKTRLGEIPGVAVAEHPVDEFVFEDPDPAGPFERGHCAPQTVRLRRCETGGHDGDLHRLLLKERHTVRFFRTCSSSGDG